MTLTLKSLNSAIEAMQDEIKATDNLNAKLAETIARLERLGELSDSVDDIKKAQDNLAPNLTLVYRLVDSQGRQIEALEKQVAYFMREREAIVNYYRGPIQALSERLDALEKRDAVNEAAKAIKGRVQAIWKAAKV